MRASAALLAISLLLAPRAASAFCRTMACPLPPGFTPSPGACVPGDFASWCASLQPAAKPLPVWWRNACVGYDLQQGASKQVPYATADAMFAAAFAKWTSVTCTGAPAGDSARVSIDTRDLGPVQCDQVQYNDDQGNQHVILFHDDVWPHDDANNTLGLTTITFDPDTGEIYDADMEINATVPLTVSDPVPKDGYDLQSIITHESGHFLGMAHSGDNYATMYAIYVHGTTTMRTLHDDDREGICSIYPPGGTRNTDPSVSGGSVVEDPCDPTPRHGFSAQCGSTPSKGCAVGDSPPAGPGPGAALGALVAAIAAIAHRVARVRRRAPPGSARCAT
jgi:hypothetical protein